MLFNSYEFIFFFLPIAVITYYTAGILWNQYFANTALVALYYFFYAWWEPVYAPVLAGLTVGNYLIGAAIAKNRESNQAKSKKIAFYGITFNLAVLAAFKYTGFILSNIGSILSINIAAPLIALPLGISFFTFQKIAYLSDTVKANEKRPSFVNFAAFVVSAHPPPPVGAHVA